MAFSFANILLPIRVVQAVLAIIVLGISAYFVSEYDGNAPRMAFLVFVSIWTLLVVIYFVVADRFMQRLSHGIAILVLEALSMLFWFAGWVAVATWLGDDHYVGWPRRHATAATVFGAFAWLAFVVSFVVALLGFLRNRGSSHSKTAPAAGQAPYV